MIVLRANISYLRTIGMVLPENQPVEKTRNLVYNVIYSTPLTLTIGGLIAYFIDSLTQSDMQKATASSYEIFGLNIVLSGFWIFVLQKNRFVEAINDLQAIIDQRMRSIYSVCS